MASFMLGTDRVLSLAESNRISSGHLLLFPMLPALIYNLNYLDVLLHTTSNFDSTKSKSRI